MGTTPFALVLSHQPTGLITVNLVSPIPDDMKEPSHPKSFCSPFRRPKDVLQNKIDAKLATVQARYKLNFDKTLQPTL